LDLSPDHPLAERDLAMLASDGELPPLVATASEGVAEALYGLGSALAADTSSSLAELYLNLALYMRPDFDIARSLLGGAYEAQERWADAVASYSKVGKDSPLYLNARIQTAMALNEMEKEGEAISVLERVSKDYPERVEPLVAM